MEQATTSITTSRLDQIKTFHRFKLFPTAAKQVDSGQPSLVQLDLCFTFPKYRTKDMFFNHDFYQSFCKKYLYVNDDEFRKIVSLLQSSCSEQ